MEKFKQWLQNLMKNRYGSDELTFVLLISGIVIMILGSVIAIEPAVLICSLVSIVLYCIAVYRSFSTDIAKRRAENAKFQSIFKRKSESLKQAQKEQKKLIKEKQKTHILFYCPECKASCWVPKNKGKIRITCPKCGTKFIGKT
ncbi:MAG: hypothetical protein GX903_01100 [Spirochaetales bacterium]|nr:hypothetical protein [Spirochaetales bacterium]